MIGLLLLMFTVHVTFAAQNLTSPLVTNWGEWGSFERCPEGTKVVAVQVKTEPWDSWDGFWDDTCLNGIRFFCGQPGTSDISSVISSSEGDWGNWGKATYCNGFGYLIGFMMAIEEEYTPLLDETATNNMRILCAGSESGFIQLDGEQWGTWTNPRICNPNLEYICGLQTQVQEPQGLFSDDTALNNIRVECCDLPE